MQEHRIVLPKGDAVVADGATLDFGLDAPGRVFVGERAELGSVCAKGDIRIDLWTRVKGDVESSGNVFLGERVRVEGKLTVAQDLDVGDDVKLEKGFEARGWINIRNPVPMVMYVFLYLLQLVGQGKGDEVDRILKQLEEAEDAEALVLDETYLFVPKGARIGLQETIVHGALVAGANCRLVGNHRVDGDARIGPKTTVHGSLEAGGHIVLGDGCEIVGDVAAHGAVEMHPGARVHGTIRADHGVRFVTEAQRTAAEKVDDFEAGREDLGRLF